MYTHLSLPHEQHHKDLVHEKPFVFENDLLDIKNGRANLARLEEELVSLFSEGYAIADLLLYRSAAMDDMLSQLYKLHHLDTIPDLALIAVGGYGRAELFLESDIDIQLISRDSLSAEAQGYVSTFISHLWDLKLDIGSAVRTLYEALQESNKDITIRTNMLETRHICGNHDVYLELKKLLKERSAWTEENFFHSKVAEELERHHSYKDTSYALEPDLKNNPGGIRDLQIMQWLAIFLFEAYTPEDMLELNLLSHEEYDELIECRNVLFQVRYALHIVIRREDNRLTLDSQPAVSRLLGFTGEGNSPVESMMRELFRCLRRVRELNSIALQTEMINLSKNDDEPHYLTNDFVQRGLLIDTLDDDLFINNKSKLLEIFLVLSRHNKVIGLHVHAIRLLRQSRRKLTNYLVEIPACRALFKSMLESPAIAFTALPLMHEYRILSAYMPSWAHIEGLSQFDMFHNFSVDEHTIRVIKNIDHLSHSTETTHELFHHAYTQISNVEILLVAALLHDIAKGQGGHHAQLGAGEALYFCQLHKYTLYQTRLISWLVYNHLLFSSTALRRDINDPQIVNEFSRQIQDEEHLNLLYCLTVADICATNDHEWNSWKDQVFRQLYFATRQALRHGLEMPQDIRLHANENQQLALKLIHDVDKESILSFWSYFKPEYFIYYTPFELAWHLRNILSYHDESRPLILFAQHADIGTGTEVLIYDYQKSSRFNFGAITCAMAKKRLNLQSAQIVRNKLDHTLCTIKFLSQKGTHIDNDRLHSIRLAIIDGLHTTPKIEDVEKISTPAPKTQKLFKLPTIITFLADRHNDCTDLEISTLDRPGLLARITLTFDQYNLFVRAARITTTGERADDFFSVTDQNSMPLSDEMKETIRHALYSVLAQKKDSDDAE